MDGYVPHALVPGIFCYTAHRLRQWSESIGANENRAVCRIGIAAVQD